MDADTRHQLKQNELAQALEKLRDFNNPTTRYTLLGLAVVAVLFAGWKAWSYNHLRSLEQTTQRLGEVQVALASDDPAKHETAMADLRALIDETTHPGLEGLARLQLARAISDEALKKPEQRETLFQEALDVLRPATVSADTPPTIQAAATFAMATNYESLREFDQAATLYEKLTSDGRFRGSPYVDWAEMRLADLDELRTTIEFLPGNPPPPPMAAKPTTLTPTVRPEDEFVGPPAPPLESGDLEPVPPVEAAAPQPPTDDEAEQPQPEGSDSGARSQP